MVDRLLKERLKEVMSVPSGRRSYNIARKIVQKRENKKRQSAKSQIRPAVAMLLLSMESKLS